ncbi:hypothetical protein [Chitinophaga sp. S165]|uniref:hypothetical protein n=1 Tax=Chitinophaga sp. S165 TaxID=2135462 RepID=UPI000D71D620|nr:hypothetical protein [Chitinophaga sp. S165]PWV49870.1 hypothetical protein C7475_105378 [Chitinophaga sp. S165]
MEPLDDLDNLLKGASVEHNKELLTAQSISRMIDERLIETRKKLALTFRKEIRLIIIGLLFLSFSLTLSIVSGSPDRGDMIRALIYAGTILYLLVCLLLFIRLMRLSLLQKGTHIRDYVTEIHKKTKRALHVYLWISNATGIAMIAALLISFSVSWRTTLFVTIPWGVALHYINIWYIRKRFGERLDGMKALTEAFN